MYRKLISSAIVIAFAVAVIAAQSFDRFNDRVAVQGGITFNGAITTTGSATANGYTNGATAAYSWTSRGNMHAEGDGIFRFSNNAGTGFTRLVFGTNDASGSSLVKNSTGLDVRNGDGSSLTALTAGSFISNGLVNALDAALTNGSGTGITVNVSGRLQRSIYKVTIDRTAFICAALTCDVTIGTLPARTFIQGALADLTTTYACAATCTTASLSMQLGTGAGGTQFLASFDADAAATLFGDSDAEAGTNLTKAGMGTQWGTNFSWGGTQAVVLRLTSGVGNIGTGAATNLSQGSVVVMLITERLP